MNKKIILIIVSITLVAGVLLVYYNSFIKPKENIAKRCENYVPNWENFVDCYGVIAITDAWDVNYLSLKDHVHEYEVARVLSKNQYFHVNEKLYVINKNTIEGETSNGETVKYYQRLFQNGQIATKYYDSISDIPTYLVINTNSGEVNAYQDITTVPELDKEYFSRIENKR